MNYRFTSFYDILLPIFFVFVGSFDDFLGDQQMVILLSPHASHEVMPGAGEPSNASLPQLRPGELNGPFLDHFFDHEKVMKKDLRWESDR